jgi:hypothetical protein
MESVKAGDSETIGSLRHGNRCGGVVVVVVVGIQLEKKVDFGLTSPHACRTTLCAERNVRYFCFIAV